MTEWQMGMRAFREGRLREATDRLRTGASDRERTVSQDVRRQTYAFLGASLYALGDAAGAVDAFSSAVTLKSGSAAPADLLLNLANSLLAAGRRSEARKTLAEILQAYPGTIEASMLLERLDHHAESKPITGAVLGESPESVKRYLNTLSFASSPNGFSPDQVNTAITQIERYIDALSRQLASRDESVAQYSAEVERLRQSEETLVENLMRAREEADNWRKRSENRSDPIIDPQDAMRNRGNPPLSPLEKLFQRKT